MSTKDFQRGQVLDYVAGADISSGDVVVIGDLVGIAVNDIANGETGAVVICCAHMVAKTTGEAWAQGAKISWDASVSEFAASITPAAGDVSDCGVAALPAASADPTGVILFTPGTGTAA